MAKTMERIEKRIDDLIKVIVKARYRLPGQTFEDSFEIYVMHELAKARDNQAR